MLKLVRNTLGDQGSIIDGNNQRVEWKFIKLLQEMQAKEELRLGNKLTKYHVQYWKQKMKVKLAAQLFSNSVADSLSYSVKNNIKEFVGCEPTIEFLRVFNDLFDVLNARSIRNKGRKRAISPQNYISQSKVLIQAENYIKSLKDHLSVPILESRRKTGYLGFLVCIQSAIGMYKEYVNKNEPNSPLKYLTLYKISQDHLERLFGYIRSRGGFNNNPTSKQFTGTFKRLLLYSELHESNTGNTTALDKSLMFKICDSTNPIISINSSLPQWKSSNDEDRIEQDQGDEEIVVSFSNSTNLFSDITKDIVEYIAGYVSKSICSKLLCDKCFDSLIEMSSTCSTPNSLITCKNRGGLILPSSDVKKVCQICEKVVRIYLKLKNTRENVNVIGEMCNEVLKLCIGCEIFSDEHFKNSDPENSHFIYLIQSICQKYFHIRLRHHAKNFNEKVHFHKVRNDLCKKILFLGQ